MLKTPSILLLLAWSSSSYAAGSSCRAAFQAHSSTLPVYIDGPRPRLADLTTSFAVLQTDAKGWEIIPHEDSRRYESLQTATPLDAYVFRGKKDFFSNFDDGRERSVFLPGWETINEKKVLGIRRRSRDLLYNNYLLQSGEVADFVDRYKRQDSRNNATEFVFTVPRPDAGSALGIPKRDFAGRIQVLISKDPVDKLNVEQDFPDLRIGREKGQVWAEIGRALFQFSTLSPDARDIVNSRGRTDGLQRTILLKIFTWLDHDVGPDGVIIHANNVVYRYVRMHARPYPIELLAEPQVNLANGKNASEKVILIRPAALAKMTERLSLEDLIANLERAQRALEDRPRGWLQAAFRNGQAAVLRRIGFKDAYLDCLWQSLSPFISNLDWRKRGVLKWANQLSRLSGHPSASELSPFFREPDQALDEIILNPQQLNFLLRWARTKLALMPEKI